VHWCVVGLCVQLTKQADESSGVFACCLPLMPAGVLKFKHDVELALQASGLPYTILRPSRLTDGPYTSYDLNTLLQVRAWLTAVRYHSL